MHCTGKLGGVASITTGEWPSNCLVTATHTAAVRSVARQARGLGWSTRTLSNNHRMSQPPPSPDLVLQLSPGSFGEASVNLRVSPAHANELRGCLEAEGLDVGEVLEHSAEGWLDILSVSLPAALGAGGAITVAITKFFERNQGKKAAFGLEGQLLSTENLSISEIERAAKIATQLQDEISQRQVAATKSIENTPDRKSVV